MFYAENPKSTLNARMAFSGVRNPSYKRVREKSGNLGYFMSGFGGRSVSDARYTFENQYLPVNRHKTYPRLMDSYFLDILVGFRRCNLPNPQETAESDRHVQHR